MQRLAPFVGEWSLEAVSPVWAPTGVAGRTVFEWTLGGQYLLQRASADHPDAPDGLMIIGPGAGGEGFTQHYFDSRGVTRLYAMRFAAGRWELLREAPDFSPLDFSQRFTGDFTDGGGSIDGRWETLTDGGAWELDFELHYTRVG
jgi:hypothetical protein